MREKIIYVMMFLFLTSVYHADVYAKKDPAVKYTRIGAEASGNKSGDITAYEGDAGLTCPARYEKGQELPSPFKGEKKLFRIDYKNVDTYADKLTAGQVARLKMNKKSFMDIYPTHRINAFPEVFYTATEKNISTCRLDSKNNLTGYNGGIAFPYPDNASQMAWNIKRQYSGEDTMGMGFVNRIVSPSGRIKKVITNTKVMYFDETRLKPMANPEKVCQKIVQVYTYPADQAGTAILMVQYIDADTPDDQWLYLPTLRRVRRAPSLSKGAQIDGESTMDDKGAGFRGTVNDWNWKFLGKKEIYIPINCYEMFKINGKDEEECFPKDIKSEGSRWELRRVWVLEGTIKPGISHPYSKRVEYVDEDTWYPTMGDRYDRRGNLWRMYAFYSYYDWCQKIRNVIGQLHLNLESGRYEFVGGGLTKTSRQGISNSGIDPNDFTVQSLRRAGR